MNEKKKGESSAFVSPCVFMLFFSFFLYQKQKSPRPSPGAPPRASFVKWRNEPQIKRSNTESPPSSRASIAKESNRSSKLKTKKKRRDRKQRWHDVCLTNSFFKPVLFILLFLFFLINFQFRLSPRLWVLHFFPRHLKKKRQINSSLVFIFVHVHYPNLDCNEEFIGLKRTKKKKIRKKQTDERNGVKRERKLDRKFRPWISFPTLYVSRSELRGREVSCRRFERLFFIFFGVLR